MFLNNEGKNMDKVIFWNQDADFEKEFKGGMYVRSDLGKSFAKWKNSVKIVGIAIDDSNEVEFIVDESFICELIDED